MSTFEWLVVGVVVVVVLGGGSWVAVWWWRLVARAAPYKDELDRAKARTRSERQKGDEGVVIVGGHTRPDASTPPNGDVKG